MGGSSDAPRFPYASARQLIRETARAFLPPERIGVAEHAERFRWVRSPSGGQLLRYDHGTAPYLRGPMEALTEDGIETVAIVGPAASGKTAGPAESWLLQTVHSDPAEMLWYMATEDQVESYVKGRIEPMLEDHDAILAGIRLGRDAIKMKRFRGGRVEFLPFTASSLVNKHVSRIVCDEWDAYDEALGDPLALVNPRRQAAGPDSKLLAISHPDRGLPIDAPPERQRGIMKLYAASDRRTWWWACPHCGAYSSPNPGTARRMTIEYPEAAPLDVVEAEARLLCPVSGCLIEDSARPAMNATGRWLCAGETMDEEGRISGRRIASRTAGFWIVGAMSPFTMGGIGGLARERVAAERAVAAGEDLKGLRTVMSKGWGEPAAALRQVGTVDAATLAERVEPGLELGRVPEGVRFLTAWADAQNDRWEWVVRGWGPGRESWIVHHEVVPGDPAASPEDWDAMLSRLAETTFPLADGSGRRMRIRAAGFDSQGQPGVTEQAYAAWLRRRLKGKVRRLGVLEGRDVWELVPTRGASGRAPPRISIIYPDTQRKDRKAQARGQVPVLMFAPNAAKDALAAQLALSPPAVGAVHFPAALLAPSGPPHPFFEGLASETRDPVRGTWSKVSNGARNEPIDLLVGCEVVARLHGLHRLDWEKPPAWAAEWDRNSGVIAPEEAAAEGVARLAAQLRPVAAAVMRSVAPPPAKPAPAAPGVVVVQAGARSSAGARLA